MKHLTVTVELDFNGHDKPDEDTIAGDVALDIIEGIKESLDDIDLRIGGDVWCEDFSNVKFTSSVK